MNEPVRKIDPANNHIECYSIFMFYMLLYDWSWEEEANDKLNIDVDFY